MSTLLPFSPPLQTAQQRTLEPRAPLAAPAGSSVKVVTSHEPHHLPLPRPAGAGSEGRVGGERKAVPRAHTGEPGLRPARSPGPPGAGAGAGFAGLTCRRETRVLTR